MHATHLLAVLTWTTFACAQIAPATADRSYFAYGDGIGTIGFRISAVNGVAEIVVPCGSTAYSPSPGARYWILHRYNPTTSNYDQVFASPVYAENDPLVETAVGDVDSAPGPELVCATRNGRIEVWNQAARSLLGSFQVNIGDVNGLGLADVDADGDQDVVVCSSTTLQAWTRAGTPLWGLPGAGGRDLTIGQMDPDPALEIALTSGQVVDCATHTVQWHWLNGFGMDVDCGDIDGDGLAEVVFGEDWYWVWAFDIDVELPKWSLPLGDIDSIVLANADADANLEILVGEGQFGDVRVYDTTTQQLDYFIDSTESGKTSLAVGDVDADGQLEIVFGTGWTSTAADYWFVASAVSHSIEWTSPRVARGFVGPVHGDVDGDGNAELLCACPSLYGGGVRVLVFDAATLVLEHFSQAFSLAALSTQQPTDITLADVDGDGDDEAFLVASGVACLDWVGGSFVSVWQVNAPISGGPRFLRVEVADLDGNGTSEVVLGGTQYAHVFAYGSTTESWHSFYLGGETVELGLGNSDLSPGVEIHVLSQDGNLYVFDGPTRATKAVLQDGGVDRSAMALVAGFPALLLGDENGHMFLYLHDGSDYLWIGPLPVANGPIHGIGWIPQLGMLHIASEQRLAIQNGLLPLWQTAAFGDGFGDEFVIDLTAGYIATCSTFGLSRFDI